MAIPLLLVSACTAGDVTLNTKINSYTVPDEMTEIFRQSKMDLIEIMEGELESNDAYLQNAQDISSGTAFTKNYRRKYRRSMYGLQVIANYLQEAIKYAKASTLDEEYGFLLFTYIKTDINGNRSAHEDKVHCMKKPEGSPKSHPFVKMLDAKYKIDDRRSSKDGITFRYGGEPWNLTREQKDLAELSKKLCRRYFSFEKGSFYIKGQTPMRFDK